MRIQPADFRQSLKHSSGEVAWYSLPALAQKHGADLARLPYSIRVLLESALRNHDGFKITDTDVERLLNWTPKAAGDVEIAFKPARVVSAGFHRCAGHCGPGRHARRHAAAWARTIRKINPLVPCDLVIDHSVQVDACGIARRASHQRGTRIRAQSRALRIPQVGTEGIPEFPRGAARRPASCTRSISSTSRAACSSRETAVAYPDSLVGTRQPHDHDQRPWRCRLGRGRYRSGSRDARPTHLSW